MSKNITYQTSALDAFYRHNRRHWNEFYPSEQKVFETIAERGAAFRRVLDVGCAAGGLGDALSERFASIKSYTGVDINRQAIETATALAAKSAIAKRFIRGDICDCPDLAHETFDLVTALGVADWNLDPEGIMDRCWEHVQPGGYLVISLRLTPARTICDISRSFQYVWFEPTPPPTDAEKAPYNVFNVADAMRWLRGLNPRPASIYCYGYWGKPSAMARTPYDRLVFSVIGLQKSENPVQQTKIDAELPADVAPQAGSEWAKDR